MRILVIALLAAGLSGCVTVAEFRKLERSVRDLEQAQTDVGERARLAELADQVAGLEQSLAELQGRLEVTEHRAQRALDEARTARSQAAEAAALMPRDSETGSTPASRSEEPALSEEVRAYREAYAAWRSGELGVCIDLFREFLQNHASSAYADDASYWRADCYFKQGDYKTAVVRFDDVVALYPTGNKAADALYRQGEALLRLGPGYAKAASRAFERVLKDYPDSARAPEARRQLEVLESG